MVDRDRGKEGRREGAREGGMNVMGGRLGRRLLGGHCLGCLGLGCWLNGRLGEC